MSFTGLSEAFNLGSKILDKLFPDPQKKQEAQIELLRLEQSGVLAQLDSETKLALAQNEVNKQEAASPNWFIAGWRPFIGWSCGFIFCANYIGVPFLAWISPLFDIPPPPRLEIGEVLPVLLGMLGLGSMRSVEKVKGALK